MNGVKLLIIYFFLLIAGCRYYTRFQDSDKYSYKFFRNFSFHTQQFRQPISSNLNAKFCYKVYYNKSTQKRYAFEFIDEKGNAEFIGYFNAIEKIKKIEVLDYKRGRMNMQFFYNLKNKINKVKLLDDTKNIFAYGEVNYSNNSRVIFIKFNQSDIRKPRLFYIIRRDKKGNDVEIAAYSSNGSLFTNNLFFYYKDNKLKKYEFYKKLNLITKIEFDRTGRMVNIKYNPSTEDDNKIRFNVER